MFKQRIGHKYARFTVNELINYICIVFLSGLILFTPLYSFKRIAILFGSFIIWYLSTLTIDRRWLRKQYKTILFIIVFFLLDVFYSLTNGSLEPMHYFIMHKFFVYIWLLIFAFYAENKKLMFTPVSLMLIMTGISCIFTIRGNLIYPGASRRLASGGDLAMFYHSIFIGGYDFIYGLVFLIMPLVIGLKKRVVKTIPTFFFLIGIFITLVIGSYAISILLALGMLICSIAGRKNKIRSYIITIILIILIIIFRIEMLNMLINIGNEIDSYMLVRRATQLRDMTYFSDYGMSEYNRFALYLNGFKNFIRHPFFGKMGGVHDDVLYAGHSELINYFDSYGFFGLVYVFYWVYSYQKVFMSKEIVENYKLYYLFVWVFLFFETIYIAPATALVINFLAPALFVCIEELQGNQTSEIKAR